MRALRFDRFGDPGVLHVAEMPDPVATAQEAVIRVEAASVNPSDVKNVAGKMDWTVLPRTPGRDFAGVVVCGPTEWRGAAVWGTGGDVGFTRDGSHAELMSVPVEALVRKPERLSFDEASAVGVNFVVGWYGTVETAQLAAGETIAIFDPAVDVGAEIKQLTGGAGVEVVYDAVGGVTTPAALASLAHRGRLVVISAVGADSVGIDLRDLYHNETRILGTDSGKLSIVESAKRLEKISPYFESGEFRPLPVAARYPLDEGGAAYRAVADRIAGRVVINP